MRLFAALSLSFLLSGCGLLDRLNNNVILVATLLQSPTPPQAIGGSPVVEATLYLAQKSGDLTSPPSEASLTPISGATVVLSDGASTWTLAASGAAGNYATTGATYTAGRTYRFTATVGSDQYWAEVASVPSTPTLTLPGTPANEVYTYTSYADTGQFPDPYPISRTGTDIAFYSVWSLSGAFNPTATPNCTNFPKTAGDFLTLVFVNDAPYRAATFNVPKTTCFPEPGNFPAKYLVGLAAVKKDSALSGNLSIYSGAIAGTSAAAGVFVTLP